MDRFGVSWIGVCRIFKLASEANYKDVPRSTLCHLFYQCSFEEKQKLKELFPDLINNMQKDMKHSDFYKNHVIED